MEVNINGSVRESFIKYIEGKYCISLSNDDSEDTICYLSKKIGKLTKDLHEINESIKRLKMTDGRTLKIQMDNNNIHLKGEYSFNNDKQSKILLEASTNQKKIADGLVKGSKDNVDISLLKEFLNRFLKTETNLESPELKQWKDVISYRRVLEESLYHSRDEIESDLNDTKDMYIDLINVREMAKKNLEYLED